MNQQALAGGAGTEGTDTKDERGERRVIDGQGQGVVERFGERKALLILEHIQKLLPDLWALQCFAWTLPDVVEPEVDRLLTEHLQDWHPKIVVEGRKINAWLSSQDPQFFWAASFWGWEGAAGVDVLAAALQNPSTRDKKHVCSAHEQDEIERNDRK